MSQPINKAIIIHTRIACPYCGKPNQLDPPYECCGEVHPVRCFFKEDGDMIEPDEIQKLRQTCEVILVHQ